MRSVCVDGWLTDMAEITDKGIIWAALNVFAMDIWREVESGQRYFGTDFHVDLFKRTIKIQKSFEEGGPVTIQVD